MIDEAFVIMYRMLFSIPDHHLAGSANVYVVLIIWSSTGFEHSFLLKQ